MAWSWSHTHEAYEYAEAELRKLPHETLAEIYAEWKATTYGRDSDEDIAFEERDSFDIAHFDAEKYPAILNGALKLPSDVLAGEIWQHADAQQTCDNGGYNAWMCPYGCMPHCVDFGPQDESEIRETLRSIREEE